LEALRVVLLFIFDLFALVVCNVSFFFIFIFLGGEKKGGGEREGVI